MIHELLFNIQSFSVRLQEYSGSNFYVVMYTKLINLPVMNHIDFFFFDSGFNPLLIF